MSFGDIFNILTEMSLFLICCISSDFKTVWKISCMSSHDRFWGQRGWGREFSFPQTVLTFTVHLNFIPCIRLLLTFLKIL